MKTRWFLGMSWLLFFCSCYKESTTIENKDKDCISLTSVTEPYRTLPINSETQHVISATTINTGIYHYQLRYLSTMGLDYSCTEYPVSGSSYNGYFILVQTIPSSLNLVGKTDTTYLFLQQSDYYSDSVILVTRFIQAFCDDSLVLYSKFNLDIELMEHISGFTYDHYWHQSKSNEINYSENKYIAVWSDLYETGKLTISLNSMHTRITHLEYTSIYDNYFNTTTYKFFSDHLYLYNMDSATIELGYYGPELLYEGYFDYQKYPPDTIFQNSYYVNEDSYFFVELKKD